MTCPESSSTLPASGANHDGSTTSGASMHRRRRCECVPQGISTDVGSTRMHLADGILNWQERSASSLMSTHVISHPLSARILPHRPPPHPRSTAFPGRPANARPRRMMARSFSARYRPHRVVSPSTSHWSRFAASFTSCTLNNITCWKQEVAASHRRQLLST